MTIHINDDEFEEKVLEASGPILVEFCWELSDICERMDPVLDEFAKERTGKITVVRMNIENNRDTALKYGVRSVPTLILFKDGKLLDVEIGSRSKLELAAWIESVIARCG